MLNIDNSLVVLAFLFLLMVFENCLYCETTLAITIRICYAHVEKGILAWSPKSLCTDIKARFILEISGFLEVGLVGDFLKRWLDLDIITH